MLPEEKRAAIEGRNEKAKKGNQSSPLRAQWAVQIGRMYRCRETHQPRMSAAHFGAPNVWGRIRYSSNSFENDRFNTDAEP
jgi:hypothetical protein